AFSSQQPEKFLPLICTDDTDEDRDIGKSGHRASSEGQNLTTDEDGWKRLPKSPTLPKLEIEETRIHRGGAEKIRAAEKSKAYHG
ncbi:MAG TPA: hypothetical protein VHA06_15065, partial [Candidatus Angelobacter sp.]|nr:hypothetical protein [Candidatus Angelobacter sp.]